jgi:hypothetical protein
VARITHLAEQSTTWSDLSVTTVLFVLGILAFGPGLFAVLRFIDRVATSPRLMRRLVAEEAPRPGDGPA